jgi:hypothetical protein
MVERLQEAPNPRQKGRKAAGTASKFSKKRLSFNTKKYVFFSTL